MKSLMLLWLQIAEDFGDKCCVSTIKDYETVLERVEHEGVSFLTITLPTFASDFEKSLDQGFVASDSFPSFRKRAGLPLFLGGFLKLVFSSDGKRLLDEPSIEAIFAVRQLSVLFKKILLECSDARRASAILGYLKCEQEVKETDAKVTAEQLDSFHRVSSLLFRDVFTKMDSSVFYGDVLPKHGPGKTADGLLGNKKYDLMAWPQRLDDIFPYGEYGVPSLNQVENQLDRINFLEPGSEVPVKVVLVPKTLKTPRVIAIEPTAMQYMQQAILEPLVDLLETDGTVSGMIGFSDQSPNQRLAQEGSKDGSLATIDLSEASDRVSNQHVRVMLRNFPNFLAGVDACRSRKADVPGHGVIRLAKFASMGSALCFPFEAMVFLTLVFMGIENSANRPLTRKDIKQFAGKVRVYGDDIIVPSDYARSVVDVLDTFGYRVNRTKSFWTGLFRESCGKEYFAGFDVTAVKCRRVIPTSRTDVQETVSLVSLRNQLYFAGLWKSARYLDNMLDRLLEFYPAVAQESSVLGRHSFLNHIYDVTKISVDLHAPLVKGYVVSSNPPPSRVSGEGALLKFLLKRGDLPIADSKHLERQGRPKSVNMKLRLASPF